MVDSPYIKVKSLYLLDRFDKSVNFMYIEEVIGKIHFLEAPKIVVEPPGPKAIALLKMQEELEGKAVLYPSSIPFVPEEGLGATIKDVDGNTYIDFFSGISVLNFGHSNPYILEKTIEQLKKLAHTLDFPTEYREKLVEKLLLIAPGEMKNRSKVLFGGPTGSDAIESAIKLAKWITRKHAVIAFEGSYHGQTSMSLNLSSGRRFKDPYIPLSPDVYFAPYAYCYRCPFKLEHPECGLRCSDYLEHLIEDPYSGIPTPAAILIEPIQGEGGIIIPPDGFLQRIRRIADKHGIPLIVDEIQAGMGRTGRWFACEHYNVTPDIVTLAKSLGGVGLPLSAIIYRKELDMWEPGAHLGTFRGNVVAMASGYAAIEFAEKIKLLDHVTKLGEEALKYLKDVSLERRSIGEVRGKGLMIALELVKNKDTKEPDKELATKIQIKSFKKGVLVWKAGHYGNVIRLLPPLVITRELMMKGLEILGETIAEIEKTT